MPTIARHRWSLRLATLVLWLLCGASLVYWGLKLMQPGARATAPQPAPEAVVVDAQALARALGADAAPGAPAAAPAPARLVLRGVLAGTRSGHGAALIEIDGKPAKPYRVGAAVEPGLVVQSLDRREARLGATVDGATTMTLELARKS